MLALPEERDVLESLIALGQANASIRAIILTGSRSRTDGSADLLSDYDVIVAVRDADAFDADDAWVSGYGQPLVRWGDQHELYGRTTYFRGVIYVDGVRVDYTLWSDALLQRVAEETALPEDLDVGYRVLLDKDDLTPRCQSATYAAHIPAKPTRAEYDTLVDEFWWDTTYVAKSLWRGEVVFAKFMLDYDTKFVALRRFLEWRIEIDHDWALRPGAYGRGLERLLPADIWSELASTLRWDGYRGQLERALSHDSSLPASRDRSRRCAWLRVPTTGGRRGERVPRGSAAASAQWLSQGALRNHWHGRPVGKDHRMK